MNKEYYHANEIREEPTWSGGVVSLNGSHVTLTKVTQLKSPEPIEKWLFHRIEGFSKKLKGLKIPRDSQFKGTIVTEISRQREL